MSEKVIEGLVGAILKYDQMILDYDYIAKSNTSAQAMADIDLASIDVDEDLESVTELVVWADHYVSNHTDYRLRLGTRGGKY